MQAKNMPLCTWAINVKNVPMSHASTEYVYRLQKYIICPKVMYLQNMFIGYNST